MTELEACSDSSERNHEFMHRHAFIQGFTLFTHATNSTSFTLDQLVATEIWVLNTLQFMLNIPTGLLFVNALAYRHHLDLEACGAIHNSNAK